MPYGDDYKCLLKIHSYGSLLWCFQEIARHLLSNG